MHYAGSGHFVTCTDIGDARFFIGDQLEDTVAGFSQFLYGFSFSRLTKGRRNDLVNGIQVGWAFIADVNYHPGLSTEQHDRQYETDQDRLESKP